MRRYVSVHFWGMLCCISLLLGACAKEDFGIPVRCDCGPGAVETLQEAKGVLYFNQQLKKYTIARADTSAPAGSQKLFVLAEVPSGYPLQPQEVVFSGQIKPVCPGTFPASGTQYFDISLSKLKRVE